MRDHARRLNALARLYERPETPRLLICERDPLGKLVKLGALEEVEPRPQDQVIVFGFRDDGLLE